MTTKNTYKKNYIYIILKIYIYINMTSHFEKWSDAYHHYIDEWYDKFIIMYNSYGYYGEDVPLRNYFYWYCYINTRGYWDKKEKKIIPPIVFTPRKEEDMMCLLPF
jgi:hypothetical protein